MDSFFTGVFTTYRKWNSSVIGRESGVIHCGHCRNYIIPFSFMAFGVSFFEFLRTVTLNISARCDYGFLELESSSHQMVRAQWAIHRFLLLILLWDINGRIIFGHRIIVTHTVAAINQPRVLLWSTSVKSSTLDWIPSIPFVICLVIFYLHLVQSILYTQK